MTLFHLSRGVVDRERIDAWLRGVAEARPHWVADFKEAQFSLGRAWYTHLEQGRAAEYFARARESDALVERYCPGLQTFMRELASAHLSARVVPREGWCGAGVHVFPANGLCAKRGGDIHFDHEGLTPAQLAERVTAVTFVLMLQPAERGGGLEVWDHRYVSSASYEDEDLARAHAVADYAAGDLVAMDSYRLHQIQPFTGMTDRISATLHTAWTGEAFESWF